MSFLDILASPTPGDELKEWQGPYPVLFKKASQITAGPYPWHTGTLLDHMIRCMNAVAGDPVAVWMAMAHDLGKLTTPQAMLPHHYGHEKRGEVLARIWADQLGLDNEYSKAGCQAACWHMRAGRYIKLRYGKRLKLLETFPPISSGRSFWKLVDADSKNNISELAFKDWMEIKEIVTKEQLKNRRKMVHKTR